MDISTVISGAKFNKGMGVEQATRLGRTFPENSVPAIYRHTIARKTDASVIESTVPVRIPSPMQGKYKMSYYIYVLTL